MNKAAFLDRDGTCNKMIGNHAPFTPDELEIYDYTVDSLKKLIEKDYHLFLITNQPNWAKGEVPLRNLLDIHDKFVEIMEDNDIYFRKYYICWHQRTDNCDCMKPNSWFPLEAQKMYNLDFSQCWFVGDQDSDVLCGQKYNMKTILLNTSNSVHKRGKSNPDYFVENLKEGVDIICQ